MSDLDNVRMAVHQMYIDRYCRLLRTKLSDLERAYIERRLAEERQALAVLQARARAARARRLAKGRSCCLVAGSRACLRPETPSAGA